MAGIIFKWRYLKAGASGKHSENLIKYIATRDGVEKLDDSWKTLPATKAQQKLIEQILSDYPDTADSFEYQDYEKTKTKGAASEFITHAVEDKVDLIGKRENYVGYIAMRPHVEKTGAHSLFTDAGVPINCPPLPKRWRITRAWCSPKSSPFAGRMQQDSVMIPAKRGGICSAARRKKWWRR